VDVSEEWHPVIRIPLERRVAVLLGRVDKNFGLCLGELTEPDHALAGRDLVPVGLPYLHGTKGEFVAVEAEQPGKVHEHPLRCFGAEVADPLGTGADGRLEHEVEVVDLDVSQHLAAGRALAGGNGSRKSRIVHRRSIRNPAAVGNMVGPQVFIAVRALAHLVREAFHVPRSDKNGFLSNRRTLDLVIAFLDYVKMPPDILDPPLHHGAKGAVIDKTGHRTVTLRGRPDKAPALGKVHDILKNIAHGDHWDICRIHVCTTPDKKARVRYRAVPVTTLCSRAGRGVNRIRSGTGPFGTAQK
jgi:hypothetical protein